jgi:hypothetical protein
MVGADVTDDDPEALEPGVRDFLFEYLKDAPERQLQDASDLDGKMVGLFGAASVVIGLVSIGNLGGSGKSSGAVTGVLIAAAACYVLAAIAALVHLVPVTLRRALHADTLRPAAAAHHKSKDVVVDFLLGSIETAYAKNKDKLRRKGWTLLAVTILLGLEVTMVAAALVASRF